MKLMKYSTLALVVAMTSIPLVDAKSINPANPSNWDFVQTKQQKVREKVQRNIVTYLQQHGYNAQAQKQELNALFNDALANIMNKLQAFKIAQNTFYNTLPNVVAALEILSRDGRATFITVVQAKVPADFAESKQLLTFLNTLNNNKQLMLEEGKDFYQALQNPANNALVWSSALPYPVVVNFLINHKVPFNAQTAFNALQKGYGASASLLVGALSKPEAENLVNQVLASKIDINKVYDNNQTLLDMIPAKKLNTARTLLLNQGAQSAVALQQK